MQICGRTVVCSSFLTSSCRSCRRPLPAPAPYYRELAIDPAAPVPSSNRTAFDPVMCEVVEETKPDVVCSNLAGNPIALLF